MYREKANWEVDCVIEWWWKKLITTLLVRHWCQMTASLHILLRSNVIILISVCGVSFDCNSALAFFPSKREYRCARLEEKFISELWRGNGKTLRNFYPLCHHPLESYLSNKCFTFSNSRIFRFESNPFASLHVSNNLYFLDFLQISYTLLRGDGLNSSSGGSDVSSECAEMSPGLICVARRIPSTEKHLSTPIEQFTTKLDTSGRIVGIDTSGSSSTYSNHLNKVRLLRY